MPVESKDKNYLELQIMKLQIRSTNTKLSSKTFGDRHTNLNWHSQVSRYVVFPLLSI